MIARTFFTGVFGSSLLAAVVLGSITNSGHC